MGDAALIDKGPSYRASDTWDSLMLDEDSRRKPWRKVALAGFLFMLGATLLAAGLGLWYNGNAGDGSCEFKKRDRQHAPWGWVLALPAISVSETLTCNNHALPLQPLRSL